MSTAGPSMPFVNKFSAVKSWAINSELLNDLPDFPVLQEKNKTSDKQISNCLMITSYVKLIQVVKFFSAVSKFSLP